MAGPTAEFQTPVDVGNTTLQLLGQPRMVSFSDDYKGAQEIAFCYDKLRRAELQRNVWRFGVRIVPLRAIDATVLAFVPGAYSATASYLYGSVVSYNGQIWEAYAGQVPAGQQPDISPAYWDVYSGAMNAVPWTYLSDQLGPGAWSSTETYDAGDTVVGSDGYVYEALDDGLVNINPVGDNGVHWLQESLSVLNTGGYYAGELVYILTGTTVVVYRSLINGNGISPAAVPAWSASTTYNKGDTVTKSAVTYQSLIDLNLNNSPPSAQWELVPGTQPDQMVGQGWLMLGSATLASMKFTYPIGSGPGTQSTTRNAFQLPNGYLKEAPQDPKAGQISFLGAPSNTAQNDWEFVDNFVTSSDTSIILLRFMADVTAVPRMTSMFCQGLACRIGTQVCESLTQSTAKLQMLASEYKGFMGEARASNAIENSSDEPPVDDWIACRI